jgi:hypothetical protein
MKPFIVKVQWPIGSSEPDPPVLIYNEDRSLLKVMPTSEALRKAMNGRPKVYFWATLSEEECEGDHFISFGKQAPDQY